MPAWMQIEAAFFGISVGILLFAMVWLIVSDGYFRKAIYDVAPESDPCPAPVGDVEDFPGGIEEASAPPTRFITVLIGAFIVWSIGYVGWYLFAPGSPHQSIFAKILGQ
jgi:hypothetical protein